VFITAPFKGAGGSTTVIVATVWDGAEGALVDADIVGAVAAVAITRSWVGCVGCVVSG